MTELLFNSWWVPALVILAGVLLWVGGNKRADARVRWGGLVVGLLGVLLFVAGFLYETPNKRVTRLSKELVKSVVDQDWNKTQSLLDPHVTLMVLGASTPYHSRDELLNGAKSATQHYGIHGASADVEEVRKQGGMLTTTLKVFADADFGGGHPVPTSWQLDWEKDESGAWTVHDIRCVEIGTFKGNDALQLIPQGK